MRTVVEERSVSRRIYSMRRKHPLVLVLVLWLPWVREENHIFREWQEGYTRQGNGRGDRLDLRLANTVRVQVFKFLATS
jgi:hypothetical protein